MYYILPTARCLGVEFWGNQFELANLYDQLNKFFIVRDDLKHKNGGGIEKILSSFLYEIRHAYQHDRLIKEDKFGCKISWVHLFFSIGAIKYNMSIVDHNKQDKALILNLEYWTEKCLDSHGLKIANLLKPYVDDAIFMGNENIYQYMRMINFEFFSLKGGKRGLKKLHELMATAVYGTVEYEAYKNQLIVDAELNNCKTYELEINDDNLEIYNQKW